MTAVVGKPKKLKPQLHKESYVLLLSFNKNNNHSNNSNNNNKMVHAAYKWAEGRRRVLDGCSSARRGAVIHDVTCWGPGWLIHQHPPSRSRCRATLSTIVHMWMQHPRARKICIYIRCQLMLTALATEKKRKKNSKWTHTVHNEASLD